MLKKAIISHLFLFFAKLVQTMDYWSFPDDKRAFKVQFSMGEDFLH